MRSDEIILQVRLNASLQVNSVDYTDAVILQEVNDALWQTFEDPIVIKRAGYWLKSFTQTVVSGTPKYRLPDRACVGGLEMVELGYGSVPSYARLPEVSQVQAESYELAIGQTGQVQKFVMRGDQVVLLPTPGGTPLSLRMWYYLRPSRLVTQQSSTLNGGTARGQITAVDPTLRTITVSTPPFDMERVAGGVITPAAIVTGQPIDVVHDYGWSELALVGASQTLAGNVFTVGGTQDMSEIRVGDWVRNAEQTDWPALPEDFHRSLADIASVKICVQRNLKGKAQDLAQSTNADLARFISILQPRVKNESIVLRPDLPGIRGRPAVYWPNFP